MEFPPGFRCFFAMEVGNPERYSVKKPGFLGGFKNLVEKPGDEEKNKHQVLPSDPFGGFK